MKLELDKEIHGYVFHPGGFLTVRSIFGLPMDESMAKYDQPLFSFGVILTPIMNRDSRFLCTLRPDQGAGDLLLVFCDSNDRNVVMLNNKYGDRLFDFSQSIELLGDKMIEASRNYAHVLRLKANFLDMAAYKFNDTGEILYQGPDKTVS